MSRRVTTVQGVTRQEAIDALVNVRALTLHVEPRDLYAAIVLTDLDRQRTLVVVDEALACSLEEVT